MLFARKILRLLDACPQHWTPLLTFVWRPDFYPLHTSRKWPYNHSPAFSVFILSLNFIPPDVTMAARFSISSDSDSEPSEEVDEGERNSSLSEQERQVLQRHTLTLPELRLTGRKAF